MLAEIQQLAHEISSLQEVFYKKCALKNFAKFSNEHQRCNLFYSPVAFVEKLGPVEILCLKIRKGHTSFFVFEFSNFKLVPINSELNSAMKNQTYFYKKFARGTGKSSQT